MIELEIIKKVCKKHGVSLVELMGYSHRKKIVDARQDLALRLRKRGFSYPEIAVIMGNRDHTSIMNLIERAKKLSTA